MLTMLIHWMIISRIRELFIELRLESVPIWMTTWKRGRGRKREEGENHHRRASEGLEESENEEFESAIMMRNTDWCYIDSPHNGKEPLWLKIVTELSRRRVKHFYLGPCFVSLCLSIRISKSELKDTRNIYCTKIERRQTESTKGERGA